MKHQFYILLDEINNVSTLEVEKKRYEITHYK